jgi:hypothetical protein
MKKCPKCNWENRDDVTKCVLCATDFEGSAAVAAPAPPSGSIDQAAGSSPTYSYQGQQTVSPPAPPSAKTSAYDSAIKSGGGWFYWIAGLSLINTIIVLAHGNISFVVGLGTTQIFDYAAREYPGAAPIAIFMNLIIVGIYVMFGYFGCKRARWAFITGITLYSLDTLLVLIAQEWRMLIFHGFALFCISKGLAAAVAAKKAERPSGPVI